MSNRRIALVGGDEFRPGCLEMDRAILASTGSERPRVAIVPTAAAAQGPDKAASNGVAHFSALGADAYPLMVLGPAQANNEEFLTPLHSSDVVYLTGGDPTHLLDTLRGSRLLDILLGTPDRGAVLAGSSAGAMVLGSWMRFRRWADALGVVANVAVLPHHEGSDSDRVAAELERDGPPGALVLGIDAETACYGVGDEWEVLGSGSVTLYSGGAWRRYDTGDAVPISA